MTNGLMRMQLATIQTIIFWFHDHAAKYGYQTAKFASVLESVETRVMIPLWSGSTKSRDISTGPLARPFARSLAPLTRLLASDCSLCSRPPLSSLVRSLAHFALSLARWKVNFWCLKMTWFCPIVDFRANDGRKAESESGPGEPRGIDIIEVKENKCFSWDWF